MIPYLQDGGLLGQLLGKQTLDGKKALERINQHSGLLPRSLDSGVTQVLYRSLPDSEGPALIPQNAKEVGVRNAERPAEVRDLRSSCVFWCEVLACHHCASHHGC